MQRKAWGVKCKEEKTGRDSLPMVQGREWYPGGRERIRRKKGEKYKKKKKKKQCLEPTGVPYLQKLSLAVPRIPTSESKNCGNGVRFSVPPLARLAFLLITQSYQPIFFSFFSLSYPSSLRLRTGRNLYERRGPQLVGKLVQLGGLETFVNKR